MTNHTAALDTPLLQLSPRDVWTARDSLMHLLVLGTSGSGKSSATHLALPESSLGQDGGFLGRLLEDPGRGPAPPPEPEHGIGH